MKLDQLLSPEEEDAVYCGAYAAYNGGDFRKAALAFSGLAMACPFEFRFWAGVAAARQMERKFEEALKAWAMASLLQPENAEPHIHAAECLIQRGEPQEARKALELAAKITPEEPKIQKLYEYC